MLAMEAATKILISKMRRRNSLALLASKLILPGVQGLSQDLQKARSAERPFPRASLLVRN